MLEKILKNQIFITIVISVVVFAVINIFIIIFSSLDRDLSDSYYQDKVWNHLAFTDDIVVIWIDEKTLQELWRFPFDRREYIGLLEQLQVSQAGAIWFDIIFADQTDTQTDNDFARAVHDAGNVFLWGGIIRGEWKNQAIIQNIEKPYEALLDWNDNLWYFTAIVNKWNKKVYSIYASKTFPEWKILKEYPHFSIGLLREYYGNIYNKDYHTLRQTGGDYFYVTPDRKIPLYNTATNEVLINYVNTNKIKVYSFIDVVNGDINPKVFKDKLVIIWAVADWMNDVFNTPNWEQAGVFTHANMMNSIMTETYKKYFSKTLELLLIFFLILFSVYLNFTSSGRVLVVSNLIIIWLITIVLVILVNYLQYALNYPSQFIFALVITLTVSNILKSFMEDKNKSKLNKALGQYVSKDIAEEILHGEWKINLDGERKNISIFFSDIEWFTTISEKMNPEELVQFLREYLWAMSHIIMDERGLIDKYEWDAIMALWWVFGHEESSTFDNCNAALDQQIKLKHLNIWWKERFWEELKIRMWLHTWEAIVWNIWAAERKMEFTALWDSVNLASRLEEVNKKYGTYLCVSEVIYEEQKDNFEFRYLDKIRVKWKTIPISIYELLCKEGRCSDLEKDIISNFDSAIKLYLNREFVEAKKVFTKLSDLWDWPSKTYISRCDIYIQDAPEESWDWVWTMKTK